MVKAAPLEIVRLNQGIGWTLHCSPVTQLPEKSSHQRRLAGAKVSIQKEKCAGARAACQQRAEHFRGRTVCQEQFLLTHFASSGLERTRSLGRRSEASMPRSPPWRAAVSPAAACIATPSFAASFNENP